MHKLFYSALVAFTIVAMASCSGSKQEKGDDSSASVTAIADQPLESGQYNASYYDIMGENSRKGSFDGRVMVAISEDQSALYVYENGNRAKIDYTIVLERPFEKNDSGLYVTKDNKGLAVTINTDSTYNVLSFYKKDSQVKINFDKEASSTADAMTMMQRISEQKNKK
jgi:hypothetical protein